MVKIIGLTELRADFQKIIDNLSDIEIITRDLAALMQEYVHVDSGYLQSTIYYSGNIAGASAEYAGIEADRGGDHDYATQAIGALDLEKYLDYVVRPF